MPCRNAGPGSLSDGVVRRDAASYVNDLRAAFEPNLEPGMQRIAKADGSGDTQPGQSPVTVPVECPSESGILHTLPIA